MTLNELSDCVYALTRLRLTRKDTARRRRRAILHVDGLEERTVLSPGFAQFALPNGDTPEAIALGPDGNIWFTESNKPQIGFISPSTGAIQQFPITTGPASLPDIIAGPDGNMWFVSSGNQVGIFSPSTHSMVGAVTVPGLLQGITVGPDHAIWVTMPPEGTIARIDPTTHALTAYAVPGRPQEITAGADGNLYMTDNTGIAMGPLNDGVVEFNLATQKPTLYVQPTPSDTSTGITSGADGNIWFTEWASPMALAGAYSHIAELNLATKTITESTPIPVRQASYDAQALVSEPVWITPGPNGSLWFADSSSGVGTINPATGALAEWNLPSFGSPQTIVADRGGNLWYADGYSKSIGEVLPSGGGGGNGGGTATAPAFEKETRLTTTKRHKVTIIGYQLTFTSPLDPNTAQNTTHYQVTQPGRKKHSPPASVTVLEATYNSSTSTVLLVLGKHNARKPLTLTGTGLTGPGGTAVATFSTGL